MTALPLFSPPTFDPRHDAARISTQLAKVRDLMADGQWRTLREISDATGAPEASASARWRDLKKLGYTTQRERVGDPARGLWRYRVVGGAG